MKNSITINDLMKAERNASIKEIFLQEQKRLSNFIRNKVASAEDAEDILFLMKLKRNKVASAEDAEDILQETFYQLTENFSVLEPIEKVAAWLFKVASNKITDLYRN